MLELTATASVPRMSSDRSAIREIQRLDLQIGKLRAEIDRLPKYVAEIENKLAAHRRQLAEEKAALENSAKERKQFEAKITDVEGKIARLQGQLNEAKTNVQFRAFQHEIEYARNEISKFEDRILDQMEQAEALQERVAKAEVSLAEEAKKVASEVEQTRAAVAKDEELLKGIVADRGGVAPSIPPQLMRLYDRIRKKRDGVAVAEVESGRCTACNVVVRPHMLQRLGAGDEVMTCEFCGRILFFAAEDAVPVEDPAGEAGIT
jgi:uncharacterized protein